MTTKNADRARREARREVATAFVAEINSRTVCVDCGAQPVEWHREEHEQFPNSRISSLRSQGASVERIKREIELCEPLCRRCHMRADGRTKRLRENAPYQKGRTYTEPRPCSDCGKPTKPTRRGRCNHCYIKYMGIR